MGDEAPAVNIPTNYGRIEDFDENSEDWIQYSERLEFYFTANNIDSAEKKRAILLSVCGKKTYKLIRNLSAPHKPGEKTYDQLVELVKDHQNPKPSATVQRCKFNSRFRHPNESVSQFVAELRNISEHCDYKESLDDMLRDRLVCGIKEDRIQRRLLSEPGLTFKKAMDISIAMETAARNAQDLQVQEPKPVHKITVRKEECYRCGGNHNPHECKWKEAKCYVCDKKGHLAKKCRNKGKQHQAKMKPKFKQPMHGGNAKSKSYPNKTHLVKEDSSDSEEAYTMFHMEGSKRKPYIVTVKLNGKETNLEIDTGASLSVISQDTYSKLIGDDDLLEKSTCNLRTYTGEKIEVLGKRNVTVEYKDQNVVLPITVVKGTGPSLMGRDWLQHLKLDWKSIFKIEADSQHTEGSAQDKELLDLLSKYPNVFKEGLGTLKGTKAKIYVEKDAHPKYFKARPVPYALKDKIERELDRLEKEGTIERVEFSEWAAPIVPILKPNQSVRICGDYKVTINQASKLDNYPIPKTDDLYATLSGGQAFSKLDLSQAYQQILLDEESRKYVTINTHKGLYRYNRLPYGISSAPGIFQRTMENLLQGIPRVVVRVDDILVTGKTKQEHLETLEKVLRKLQEAGMRLNKAKCVFMAPEVVYLGHKIDKNGIYAVESKVKAITDAPIPKNVTELKSYLGMLNYYNRFLPDLATKLAPLHQLLQKQTKWKWDKPQQEAFELSKTLLKSSNVLVHYDPKKELILSCDASPYGIGAVLSHKMEDGSDRPIGYVSRTLAPAEKNSLQSHICLKLPIFV